MYNNIVAMTHSDKACPADLEGCWAAQSSSLAQSLVCGLIMSARFDTMAGKA